MNSVIYLSVVARSGRKGVMEMTEKTWNETTNGAAANSEETGWNTVSDEIQITFENEGDGFIGRFVRMDERVGVNNLTQAHFENVTDLDGNFVADRAFINAGRDLANKLRTVPLRREVRAQWTHSMDTGQASNMRVHSVQWR